MSTGTHQTTIEIRGHEVDVEVVKRLAGGRTRIDVEHPDGRRWRLEVTGKGTLDEVLTTWRDGDLADVPVPDWMDGLLLRLERR